MILQSWLWSNKLEDLFTCSEDFGKFKAGKMRSSLELETRKLLKSWLKFNIHAEIH